MRRGALAGVLALAVGCGGSGSSTDGGSVDGGDGPWIVLGGGTAGFLDLPDGAELELVAGPQGGWHVNLTARIRKDELEGVRLAYVAVPVGESAPISMPTELILDPSDFVPEGDHVLRAGDFLIMAVEDPSEVVGRELLLTVRATCPDGTVVEDTRRVRIVDEVSELTPG